MCSSSSPVHFFMCRPYEPAVTVGWEVKAAGGGWVRACKCACMRARRLSGSRPFRIVCVLWSRLQGGSLGALSCEHVRLPSISRCLLSAAFLGRRQTFLGAAPTQNHMMNRCVFSRDLNSPQSNKVCLLLLPNALLLRKLLKTTLGDVTEGIRFSLSEVSDNSWCLFGSSKPSCFFLLQKSISFRRKCWTRRVKFIVFWISKSKTASLMSAVKNKDVKMCLSTAQKNHYGPFFSADPHGREGEDLSILWPEVCQ